VVVGMKSSTVDRFFAAGPGIGARLGGSMPLSGALRAIAGHAKGFSKVRASLQAGGKSLTDGVFGAARGSAAHSAWCTAAVRQRLRRTQLAQWSRSMPEKVRDEKREGASERGLANDSLEAGRFGDRADEEATETGSGPTFCAWFTPRRRSPAAPRPDDKFSMPNEMN